MGVENENVEAPITLWTGVRRCLHVRMSSLADPAWQLSENTTTQQTQMSTAPRPSIVLDEKASYGLRSRQKLGQYDFPFTLNPTVGCSLGCSYCHSLTEESTAIDSGYADCNVAIWGYMK